MRKKIVITEQDLSTILANAILGGGTGNLKQRIMNPKNDISSTILNSIKNALSSRTNTNTMGSTEFPKLDLNTYDGFKTYESICQQFISTRKSNLLRITGKMMANAARSSFSKYGVYVPPEIALAQLALEGGFTSNKDARPIKTKNPYNVGNVDSGGNKFLNSVEDGIKIYYDLMASSYLSNNKTPDELLQNFVNKHGRRYATDKNYETKLGGLVSQIKNISSPVYAKMNTQDTSNLG